MGDTCELSVQAAAALCGEGEELSYWQLMVRPRLALLFMTRPSVAKYVYEVWQKLLLQVATCLRQSCDVKQLSLGFMLGCLVTGAQTVAYPRDYPRSPFSQEPAAVLPPPPHMARLDTMATLDNLASMPAHCVIQARAASVGRVLYGYYHVPDSSNKPIDFIINPEGMEIRSRTRCAL